MRQFLVYLLETWCVLFIIFCKRVVEVYSYESTLGGQVKVILIKDIHDFFLNLNVWEWL